MVAQQNEPFIVRPNDETALGEALQVLATDPYLRAQIGEANRAKARKHFDAADMVAAYRRLYDSALGAGVIR